MPTAPQHGGDGRERPVVSWSPTRGLGEPGHAGPGGSSSGLLIRGQHNLDSIGKCNKCHPVMFIHVIHPGMGAGWRGWGCGVAESRVGFATL